ncbi:hypothetical protein DXG03_007184 [Asterophora parasitica]|uniref:Uncharacterized protein n=1 Tax=Asterophora parasitica TaxID=117018 RepID=A0A9P7G4R0_9AGAR|nr:hypothetical protein DXG03_007184 [Asterophora parasitica]
MSAGYTRPRSSYHRVIAFYPPLASNVAAVVNSQMIDLIVIVRPPASDSYPSLPRPQFNLNSRTTPARVVSDYFLPRLSTTPAVASTSTPLLRLLPRLRVIPCLRGTIPLLMQCAPAFNYARDTHTTLLVPHSSIPPSEPPQDKAVFTSSSDFSLDMRSRFPGTQPVAFVLRTPLEAHQGHKRLGLAKAELERKLLGPLGVQTPEDPFLTKELRIRCLRLRAGIGMSALDPYDVHGLVRRGRRRYHCTAVRSRSKSSSSTSLLAPSSDSRARGSILSVARRGHHALWIRDSSCTLYALTRLGFGFTREPEANATTYMESMFKQELGWQSPDHAHGGKDLREIERARLRDGHTGSKPVHIGHDELNPWSNARRLLFCTLVFG